MHMDMRRATRLPPPPVARTAPASKQGRPLPQPAASRALAPALTLARAGVRDVLERAPAFRQLPPEKQKQLANQMVQIATYLAEPDGVRLAPDRNAPIVRQLAGEQPGSGKFVAQGAREGAQVAGLLLQQINFPNFVSGLINGVFHAIVSSSIEQMEAYAKLVADVAKSLNQFRDENVSVNQGRDHLVDQFPDLFQIDVDSGEFGEGGGPRVRMREGVDEDAALKRVNASLPPGSRALTSLDDDTVEDVLVPNARDQLATGRQQLLATMVMMGINRIVVTDGKISARVLYDFQARDNFKYQHSATQFDHQKDMFGNVQKTRSGESASEVDWKGGDRQYDKDSGRLTEDRGGSYYAKANYKYAEQPIVKLVSASQEQTDAALTTKASLAGIVEVNFKSDYLALEKMADPAQIAQLQLAARPGRTPTAIGAASAQKTAPAATNAPAGQ